MQRNTMTKRHHVPLIRGCDVMAKLARLQAHDEASGADRAEEDLAQAAVAAAKWGTETARETAAQIADAARDGTQSGLAAVGVAAERQREMTQSIAREVSQLAPAFGSLVGEQIRENLQVATVIGRSTDWKQVSRVQQEFVHGSFARLSRLSELYRVAVVETLNSMAPTSRR
jgi:hypothetical protein